MGQAARRRVAAAALVVTAAGMAAGLILAGHAGLVGQSAGCALMQLLAGI